jgi:uncharacterized membrane protein YkvA (DUF1232 family)
MDADICPKVLVFCGIVDDMILTGKDPVMVIQATIDRKYITQARVNRIPFG